MSLRLPLQQAQPPAEQPLVEARITGGMNSRIDPADVPNNVATLSKNSRTSADFTSRAPGRILLPGTDPDNKPVLMYTQYTRFDGTVVNLRFSEDRVDKYASGTWTALTGTLNGTAQDGIRFITAADASNDYFIFTNNGANAVQVLNAAVTSFGDLGNAGRYRYVCTFFNRIVAANLRGSSPNPVLVAWSGDLNFDEWNPINDISAGSVPLVEAQADYADPITGLFAFASVMLILRERSLWIATKRPVASSPFAFQAAHPSVGCDTPSSATQTRNGIVWYDLRSNQVYFYEVGRAPVSIGDAIKNDILGAITDTELVWGSYDYSRSTYFLTIPSTTTPISKVFHYNFDSNSWGYDEIEGAYGFYPVDGGVSRQTYNQLVGTYDQITASNATYNDIGLTAESPPLNYVGFKNGRLEYEANQDENSGEFVWESKIFRLPSGDMMISRLMVLFEPWRGGSFTLQYSRNGGPWQNYKTVEFTPIQGRTRTYCVKLIRANEYQFRIVSSEGNFKLLEYKIDVSASPEDK